jgi:hypothetical protein
MKRFFKQVGCTALWCAAIATTHLLSACTQENDPDLNKPETEQTDPEVTYNGTTAYSKGILFNHGTELGNGTQEFVFTGDVTLAKGTYLLRGWIYVADGAVLRIPAGTILKGQKQTKAALIVEPGGVVEMKGSRTQPIVMTSEAAPGQRRPGDWGGLIICGRALNNAGEQQIEGGPRTKHGGDNDADYSGIYQYVRVEFAGYPFQTDKEINGITFGSVGTKTVVDHLQVSYSNDDSYEWFGGSMNATHLIAYKGWDDDFDTDNGFSGTVQYALAVRDPRIADTSQSNGFESDNNATGADTAPFTSATFRNVTLIGPITARNSDFQNNSNYITAGDLVPNNDSKLGKFQAAVQIRRSSRLNLENMLAVGFPIGLIIDGEKGNTPQYAQEGKLHLRNVWFASMAALGSDNNKKYEDELLIDRQEGVYDSSQPSWSHTFFLSESSNKETSEAELTLTDPAHLGQNYLPSTMLGDGSDGYIGAFRDASDDWMEGWTNFDPQNTAY